MARPKQGAEVDELRSACEAGNSRRVVELLGSGSVTAADATACLEQTWRHLSLMRILLEHGADPAVCANTFYMGRSIELVRLLVELVYDISVSGHWILQYAPKSHSCRRAATVWLTGPKGLCQLARVHRLAP